jgi:glycosyltransferase involved in cell wall biosynthesis
MVLAMGKLRSRALPPLLPKPDMPDQPEEGASVGLIYCRGGFPASGGITTLMELLRAELHSRGQHAALVQGLWPPLPRQLVVLGCSSPWAVLQLLRQRLRQPAAKLIWVPCFHPPAYVKHKLKARVAGWVLKAAQTIGISVRSLSLQECKQLDAGRCEVISLGFSRTLASPRTSAREERSIDLVFLGRPTAQKGWPLFLDVVRRTQLNSRAFVAYEPEQPAPASLQLVVGASDAEVQRGLGRSKLLLLPADYESFGFAQAEAVAMGCCVPVLGEWPLWLDVPELDWRGLNAAAVAARVVALLSDPAQWQRLQQRQQLAWSHRTERRSPVWP